MNSILISKYICDDNSFNIWDHAVLEHWDRKISNRYPRGIFYRPPDDLPTRYYPLKGAYSSSNEKTTMSSDLRFFKTKC